jgi:hypothetical protein
VCPNVIAARGGIGHVHTAKCYHKPNNKPSVDIGKLYLEYKKNKKNEISSVKMDNLKDI